MVSYGTLTEVEKWMKSTGQSSLGEPRAERASPKSTNVGRTTAKSDQHIRFVHILFPMGNHTETSPGGLLLGKPISRAVVHRRVCHTTHSHRHTFYITQSYITHVRRRFLQSCRLSPQTHTFSFGTPRAFLAASASFGYTTRP